MTATIPSTSKAKRDEPALTLERARELFSPSELNAESDFALVYRHYHPNVRFRDAIQQLEGREAFVEMSRRILGRCSEVDARVNDAAQNGNVMFLQWTIHVRLERGPRASFEGATKLTLDADGKVIEHRDYFDAWGDALDSVPLLGRLYRAAIKKLG